MGALKSFVARSKIATFAYRYAKGIDSRYQRAAVLSTDGPGFYKKNLWRPYSVPDPTFEPIPMSPEFTGHLERMRSQGITLIENRYAELAGRLRTLLDGLELTHFRRMDSAVDFYVDIGFVLPEVIQFFADAELCGLFCNYYGRQAYYREHPFLLGNSAAESAVELASHVHVDGYRQISLQLLLNDITEEDTHLVYFGGSHKDVKYDCERVPQTVEKVAGQAGVAPILGIGKAGTLVAFDSGSGYHQGVYLDRQRVCLVGMVTAGWLPFKDPKRKDSDALRVLLKDRPTHVRRMFERL
jgi:hypothetical protein